MTQPRKRITDNEIHLGTQGCSKCGSNVRPLYCCGDGGCRRIGDSYHKGRDCPKKEHMRYSCQCGYVWFCEFAAIRASRKRGKG